MRQTCQRWCQTGQAHAPQRVGSARGEKRSDTEGRGYLLVVLLKAEDTVGDFVPSATTRGGNSRRATAARPVLDSRKSFEEESAFATCSRQFGACRSALRSPCSRVPRRPAARSWRASRHGTVTPDPGRRSLTTPPTHTPPRSRDSPHPVTASARRAARQGPRWSQQSVICQFASTSSYTATLSTPISSVTTPSTRPQPTSRMRSPAGASTIPSHSPSAEITV